MSPGNFAFYLGAFALALGILIVVHELGHFALAKLCGVKVLRFSLGFGRTLWLKRFGADQTEWAISAFPLGGYVKMLDEREGPVAPHELARAFNRQAVAKRILIVLAGPLSNLLLAVLLYWALFMHGTEELRPVLASPPAATVAAQSGVQDGELVRSINGKPVATWTELRWELLQSALEHKPITLELINRRNEIASRRMDTAGIDEADLEADLPTHLGLMLYRPQLKPIIGRVLTGSVAEAASLRSGDQFLAVNRQPVTSWNEVAAAIRKAPDQRTRFELERNGARFEVELSPGAAEEGGKRIGRIGIMVRDDPALRAQLVTTVHYGPLMALSRAAAQTWDTSLFSLRMLGRMISGEVSWRNLSGPVTIADYAGQSARMGWAQYLKFLALISISIGVLNLLPIPVLDGGHLLYYTVEIIKGGPLSERVMEVGQQIGLFLLVLLMAFAFYNDINRLFSG